MADGCEVPLKSSLRERKKLAQDKSPCDAVLGTPPKKISAP